MRTVTGKYLLYFIKVSSSFGVCFLKIAQFTLIFDLRALLDLSDHLSGIGHIEMPSEIIDAVLNRKNLRLFIERQIQFCFGIIAHHIKTVLQIVFILVNENAIVHITRIIPYLQFFFYQAVKTVEIINCKPLTRLIAERKTFSRRFFVAVNNLIKQGQHFFFLKNLLQLPFQDFVIYVIKKLADIAFQKISVRSVLPIEFTQKSGQTFHRKMRAFSYAAGGVIVNQPFVECRGKSLIADTMLNDTVAVMQGMNYTVLRAVYHKTVITGHFIGAVFQSVGNLGKIFGEVHLKINDLPSSPLTQPRNRMRFVKISEITNLIIICHHKQKNHRRDEGLPVHRQPFTVKIENIVSMRKTLPPISVFPNFFERESDSFTPDTGCRTYGYLLAKTGVKRGEQRHYHC